MMRMVGWRRRARARQMSWLWPREKGEGGLVFMGVVRGGVEVGSDGSEEGDDWVRWTWRRMWRISSSV